MIESYLQLFEEMMAEEQVNRTNYDAALLEDLYQALLEDTETDEDVDYLVYQVGVLLGHLLARDHGYQWQHITDEDGETLILVRGEDEPVYVFDLVYNLLEDESSETEEPDLFFEAFIESVRA